ncbi:MAG: cardiolipin synthase [Lachnospiraceae bacterium]|nr:cardiolipin synthase [Lachnospiraceae bacterium]
MYGLTIIFIVYSFAGWVFEVVRAATKEKRFINKGFLNGAVCPRYGLSVAASMILLSPVREQYVLVFFGCMLVGTIVEYLSAVVLEKLTGSKWWDYTESAIQFRGRVNLATIFFWGIGGTVCFYVNHTAVYCLRNVEPPIWLTGLMAAFFVLLAVDYIAACLTALAIQDKFHFLLRIAARLRLLTKRIGNRIFENRDIWQWKKETRMESARIRKIYKKIRDQRMKEWLRQRMILAAPELAADENSFRHVIRLQKLKKRHLFQKILLNRVLLTAVALIIQIIWLGILLTRFASLSREISFVMTVLSLLITVFILAKNENAAYKISWLVIILTFPVFGGVLYLFFGNKNPSRKMSTKIEKVHREKSRNLKPRKDVLETLKSDSERVAGRCRYLYEMTGSPVWRNTETTYFPLGEDMFEDMLAELEKAKHFIFLEYFIIEDGIFWGSIVDVLKRKAKEGLDVRLMYDDIGCLMLLPKEYVEEMEEAGISCIAFNPFKPVLSLAMNNRDHRKIMVIDGHTAYTGGVNLADEYINMLDRFGHWKDTGMKFTGDAVVNFTEMFLEMWNAFRETDKDFATFLVDSWKGEEEFREENKEAAEAAGFVQPFGDTPLDDDPTAENLYIDILNQAVNYVYIYTPYLIIGDTMRHALCMAAARGVDVKIITPGIPDKKLVFRMTRSNYKELLKAGVEVYEYKQGFIHAKSYVSDDTDAVIGTINMDYRSLYLHFECGAYLYKTDSIMDMKQDFLRTLKKSRKIELSVLRQGLLQEVFDAVLQIIAPLV